MNENENLRNKLNSIIAKQELTLTLVGTTEGSKKTLRKTVAANKKLRNWLNSIIKKQFKTLTSEHSFVNFASGCEIGLLHWLQNKT